MHGAGATAVSNGSGANVREPHKSQWLPVCKAFPPPVPPEFWLVSDVETLVPTEHSPPSLPVRTSSANIVAGAISADTTDKKLRNAAILSQMGNCWERFET